MKIDAPMDSAVNDGFPPLKICGSHFSLKNLKQYVRPYANPWQASEEKMQSKRFYIILIPYCKKAQSLI